MRSTIVTVFALLTVGILGSGLMAGGPAQGSEATSVAPKAQTGQSVVHRVYEGGIERFSGTSLSPDGRYFFTRTLGRLDLITGELRGVIKSGDDLLPPATPGWSESVRISPDGSRIAYAWFSYSCDCYEIRIVDTDGANHRQIMRGAPFRRGAEGDAGDGESGWWPDVHGWSPDGESLLVTFWINRNTVEISLVSAANGTRRVIRTTDGLGPNFATLSRDGRLLAYDMAEERSGTESESDVFVVPVNGGTPELVAGGPSHDVPLGWAPDGSLLVYSDRAFTEGVWRLPFSDGHPDGDLELLKGGLWGMQPVGVSGSRFAYGLRTQARQVHLTSIDLEHNRIGTTYTPVEETLRESRSPAWSADGRWLAYTTDEWAQGGSERAMRLIVQPLAGGDPREIAPEGFGGFQYPFWANGDRTLIALVRRGGSGGGWAAIDLETGTATIMGPRLDDLSAAGLDPMPFVRGLRGEFSPDLKTFYVRGDGGQVYALDLTDLERSRVLVSFDEGFVGLLSVSPSGDRIAFIGRRRSQEQRAVWVADARTGVETALYLDPRPTDRNLKTPLCGGSRAQWTSDGQFVLFQYGESIPRDAEFGPTPCKVYKIPVTGGEPVYIGALPAHRTWALHPDGTRLALEFGQNRSEIWIMEDLPGSR